MDVPPRDDGGAFATGGRGLSGGADDGKPITLRLLLPGKGEREPPPWWWAGGAPTSDIVVKDGVLRRRRGGASWLGAEGFTISAGLTRAFSRGPDDAAIADAVDSDADAWCVGRSEKDPETCARTSAWAVHA